MKALTLSLPAENAAENGVCWRHPLQYFVSLEQQIGLV